MSKIIVFGSEGFYGEVYLTIDGAKEIKIFSDELATARYIEVSPGMHSILASTASKSLRALDKVDGKSNPYETTLSGEITILEGEVLLLQCEREGMKGKLYNKVVQESQVREYKGAYPYYLFDPNAKQAKSKWVALILCIFFGFLGIHRFYEGKKVTGVIYLLTLGLLGVGVVYDFFRILFSKQ